MKDIHLEKGMHCIDCHFTQDGHGNGQLHGGYVDAVEITYRLSWRGETTCYVAYHGACCSRGWHRSRAVVFPLGGSDALVWRERDGRPVLFQRSTVTKDLEWEVVQVMDSIDPQSRYYNEKSRLAKTMQKDGKTWGSAPAQPGTLAHSEERMECFTCHLSWTTSCAGCHLPVQANWKKTVNHFEGNLTRNWTSYNPQGFGSTNLSWGSTVAPKSTRSPHCAHRVL